VHACLKAGESYTTLELKIAYHRSLTEGDLATSRNVLQSAFRHDLSRYAISSISDLAAPRSYVAKPSVNRL
jgi:hypothetical protein